MELTLPSFPTLFNPYVLRLAWVGLGIFLSLARPVTAQVPSLQWQKMLGGTDYDQANAVVPTLDGGFLAAGLTSSTDGDITANHGQVDVWAVKVDAAGQLLWQKTLGGSQDDVVNAMIATTDGGYVMVGRTNSTDGDITTNHGDIDYWVLKLDATGQLLWQRTLGGTAIDEAEAVTATSDGGLLVVGYSQSNDGDVTGNHGEYDAWVVKLDATGHLLWQKSLGGTASESVFAVRSTSDGGFLIGGSTASRNGDFRSNHGSNDFWVVKLDATGQVLWQKLLGGRGLDVALTLSLAPDGGILMGGYTYSTNGDVSGKHGIGGSADAWVIKLDATGQLLWQKCLGGTYYDQANEVISTPDGGVLMIGFTQTPNDGDVTGNHGMADAWVVKLNGAGQLLWQKALGGTQDDYARSVVPTSDGGFLIAGTSRSNEGDVRGNHGVGDVWLVKLSAPANAPLLTSFSATPTPVCAGQAVSFSASVGNLAGSYSYTLTNGAGSLMTGTATTSAFSQSLTTSGSGTQTFILTVSTSAGSATASTQVVVDPTSPDYQALADLYLATNGSSWTNHTNWLSGCSPCGWYGVSCNSTGRVISVALDNNHLVGHLPASLPQLTKLLLLNIGKNQVSGSIPPALGQIASLQALYLNDNQFSGALPDALSELGQLLLLDASRNQLTDAVPASLSKLSKLKLLSLSNNRLRGTIPASLGQLTKLQLLYLNGNKLSGSIPASLSNLSNLQYLYLNNNQLSGCLPASLSVFCGQTVDLSGNPGLPGGGNFAAFCSSGQGSCGAARQAAGIEGVGLQVALLGNPVVNHQVVVEVRGAEGQPLSFQLLEMSGKLVDERLVRQAAEEEEHRLEVPHKAVGVLLLRVSSPTQSRTIKVLPSH